MKLLEFEAAANQSYYVLVVDGNLYVDGAPGASGTHDAYKDSGNQTVSSATLVAEQKNFKHKLNVDLDDYITSQDSGNTVLRTFYRIWFDKVEVIEKDGNGKPTVIGRAPGGRFGGGTA